MNIYVFCFDCQNYLFSWLLSSLHFSSLHLYLVYEIAINATCHNSIQDYILSFALSFWWLLCINVLSQFISFPPPHIFVHICILLFLSAFIFLRLREIKVLKSMFFMTPLSETMMAVGETNCIDTCLFIVRARGTVILGLLLLSFRLLYFCVLSFLLPPLLFLSTLGLFLCCPLSLFVWLSNLPK